LAFLVLIGAVLQASLDIQRGALLDVRSGGLGEAIPADDRVVLRLFFTLDGAVGGQADGGDGLAGLSVPQLGVAGGVPMRITVLTPRILRF
jgi:hypothetical protein